MQKITPCLWFDNQAEEAANFYCSLFPNSRIKSIARNGESTSEASGRPAGSAMVVMFELEGQEFMGLNGGPMFKFSEAVSLKVSVENQEELDYFWNKLTENGGEESMCGWLKDKFGLSWQVVPTFLERIMEDPDSSRTEPVMAALMQMRKIDIATLEEAYGKSGVAG